MTTEQRGKDMSKNRRRVCRRVVTVSVLGACLGLGQTWAWGGPKKAVEHCITPTGVDLNERYGVPETIIAPFCATLNSGRYWTVSDGWGMSPTFVAVPAGFVPAGATPLEDYIAKFVGVKYVVDPGTHHEKTYVFANSADLGVFDDGVAILANPVTLGTLKPLSVGTHVVDSYLIFRAMHCDGFADSVEDDCLPPGETLFSRVQLTVRPGHN
jgi:hypothetical protein